MMPKISIITPSFNQGAFIEETLQSVQQQTYSNIEHILIDGCSTDVTLDILAKHKSKLATCVSEPDDGQYFAINKGFERATGDVYCWLNSDDKLCPWALQAVAEIFRDLPHVNWITSTQPIHWGYDGHISKCWEFRRASRQTINYGWHSVPSPQFQGFIQQESSFWRADLWKLAGGLDTNYRLAADCDLWLRFAELTELYLVDLPLGGFRVQNSQRSAVHRDQYISEAIAATNESFRRTGLRKKATIVTKTRKWLRKVPYIRSILRQLWQIPVYVITSEIANDGKRKWIATERPT